VVGLLALTASLQVPRILDQFHQASEALALDDMKTLNEAILPPEVARRVLSAQSRVFLVGDARAFWYAIPSSRLHYRTVFDVDTSDGHSTIDAWLAGLGEVGQDDVIVVDPNEISRFHRTYWQLPELPPELAGRREPFIFAR
jgi:hypothetical protein